jgi:hypothetical protein
LLAKSPSLENRGIRLVPQYDVGDPEGDRTDRVRQVEFKPVGENELPGGGDCRGGQLEVSATQTLAKSRQVYVVHHRFEE